MDIDSGRILGLCNVENVILWMVGLGITQETTDSVNGKFT